ncbi:hypothetical protein GQF01_33085 [Paenibacillus sp. 5J-6]|uniref:Uncharacterized protein n=1 Tax=Paenibacillus silvestris TaxID=2606219 RepID=A0A6L8V9E8_9BACL|nr:hypothetical protein [Paenibacillus silvestris]MZQ86957.1 hypothetical protein [Paenibacillus silvestris]
MRQLTLAIPRAAVRGTSLGVIFMALFGTLWAGIGIGGLQGWGSTGLVIAAVLIGMLLLSGGISLFAASKRLSEPAEFDTHRWKRVWIWFGMIFTIEGVAIGVASAICTATNHFNLLFPIMAIIVGVHFIPLAPLFRTKSHYVTGTLQTLLAIVTLLFVPEHATLGGHPVIAWWLVVGFGSALILWATGVKVWLIGRRWMITR